MNLQAKKLELVQLILDTSQPIKLLKAEEELKGEPYPDWWDDISEEEREAIEKGFMEADKGNLVSNELVFKKIIAKYLKKE